MGNREAGSGRRKIRRQTRRLALCVLVALAIPASAANAATYYVKTDGDNTKDGLSIETAWKTPSHATQMAFAGDTIYLLDGTWYGEVNIMFANSGAPGSPIVMKALNRRKAILDAAGGNTGVYFRNGRSHVTLDGIRFTGYHFSISSWGGEGLLSDITIDDCEVDNGYVGLYLNDIQNLKITNSYIHDIYDNCVNIGVDYYDMDNMIIRNNIISRSVQHVLLNIDGKQPGRFFHNMLVEGNVLTGQEVIDPRTSGFGFLGRFDSPSFIGVTFRNNVVRNHASAVDIDMSQDVVVENNTIYNNVYGIRNLFTMFGNKAIVRNNIVVNNLRGIWTTVDGFDLSYNDVWSNAEDDYYNCVPGSGSISVDPLLVDAATYEGDIHLRSRAGRWTETGWVLDAVTSPAIDAGDPVNDFSKEPQPNGGRINLGAYGNTEQASKTPEGPDFALSCLPDSLSAQRAASAGSTCTVASVLGFGGTVELSCSGLPAAVECRFDPARTVVPAGGDAAGALLVEVGAEASPGSYSFQASATTGQKTRVFPLTLSIEADDRDGGHDGGPDGQDDGQDDGADSGGEREGGGDGVDGGADPGGSDTSRPGAVKGGCGCVVAGRASIVVGALWLLLAALGRMAAGRRIR